MEIKTLTDTFSVSPQISVDDLSKIAAAGFRSIICNRPDAESPDQPSFSTIAESAKQAGLEVRFAPMSHQVGMTHELVAEMADALDNMPKPILAYCRSGARCTHLFMAVQQSR